MDGNYHCSCLASFPTEVTLQYHLDDYKARASSQHSSSELTLPRLKSNSIRVGSTSAEYTLVLTISTEPRATMPMLATTLIKPSNIVLTQVAPLRRFSRKGRDSDGILQRVLILPSSIHGLLSPLTQCRCRVQRNMRVLSQDIQDCQRVYKTCQPLPFRRTWYEGDIHANNVSRTQQQSRSSVVS